MGKEFDFGIVKDPRVFEENRLPARSDHIAYANEAELSAEETSLRMLLDGVWRFHYAKNPSFAPEGFWKTDYETEGWDRIRVPAHIQMEGYDKPAYVNTQYPWEGHESLVPGEIPTEFNPTGDYVTVFKVPEKWKGLPLHISFQGVESGFALWLNGSYVGYSENSFDPAEFDLSPYLLEGENKLAVRVFKWTAGSWFEDQDFYRFSGIYRSVFLYPVTPCHIADLSILPTLNESLEKGELSVRMAVRGKGKADLSLRLFGEEVLTGSMELSEDGENTFSGCVSKPLLWSAEEPNLYELLIRVTDLGGRVTEVISEDVGFRRFEMKGGLMLLNGKRIVFKGVNRHEFNCHTGRVPDPKAVEKDIITMKRHNINAIRTSHYPDDRTLYRLCDRYGLYMIAENNMETHGSWDPYNRSRGELLKTLPPEEAEKKAALPPSELQGSKEEWEFIVPNDREEDLDMLLDRVNSCYQRDKNHPAILIWSCGNESFGGKVIYEMSQLFRKLDESRLVHYEGVYWDRRYNDTSDMESRMYPPVTEIEEFLSEHREKPFICCEYTHAMGNSCGGMHKYTDLSDREELYQGGFIWDYIDQTIEKKDRYGKWFQAYGGDFGERPTDYDFSANGIVIGEDREPSPKMQEVKFNYQNISVSFEKDGKSYQVWNKNLFVNTDRYDAMEILLSDGEAVLVTNVDIEVEPLEKAEFSVSEELLSEMEKRKAAAESLGKMEPEFTIRISFRLREDTLWSPAGHEVAFGETVLKRKVTAYSCDQKLRVVPGKCNLGVIGENFHLIFSNLAGGLSSYVYGGAEMIEKIPMPNFWRAPVQNDMGNLMPQRYGQWKLASLYPSHKNAENPFMSNAPRIETKENSVSISIDYYLATVPASSCTVTYEVFGDGTVETTLRYTPVEGLPDMPEFGMLFKINADYDTVKWYGLGPEETYADRQHGGKLGIYQNRVTDNIAKYIVPQECGNKCGVRWLSVTDHKERGMIFEGDELSVNVSPWTPHEIENAAHPYELPEIHYTVIRVAEQQMGISGDDSWGAKTHPEYLLDVSKEKVFTFRFRGI